MNAPMNVPWADPTGLGEWGHWNDRHLAAVIAGWRLRLAARTRPDVDIAEELAVHAACAAEAEAALAARGQMPALTAAAERLGLESFEAEVMALALAAEVDADCAVLLPRGGRPTPGLALALLGGERPSRLLAFAPSAPLVALRVVEIEAGAPLAAAPMRLLPRLRDFLLGLDRLDEAAGFLKPLPVLDLPRRFAQLMARAAAAIGRGARIVGLVGPATAGVAVAAAAARVAGLLPVRLDPAALSSDHTTVSALIAREAALSRLAVVADLHALSGAAAEALLARPPAPLLLVTPDPAALPAGAEVITTPGDGVAARAALWRAAAPGITAAAARRIARQFDLPADAIVRVAEGDAAAIWSRARAAAAPAIRDLGERIAPRATWDDLILPAETLAALREVAAAASAREIVESRWGLTTPGSRGQGLAVLLAGPSGTGKTLAAEVLAGALGLDLFRIDLAGVVSKWIGETEKNLAKVFDAAAAGGAVLFFDEADALFGKRSEVSDSHDRYANVEVAYLLQRMEAHRGVSILATNLRANLDQAFLRRLRFAIDLPFPDEAARRAIWARHLPRRAPLAEDVDLDALARLDLPGGAIRNVALNGASLAAAAGERISMAHLLAAARREFAKLGRLLKGAAR